MSFKFHGVFRFGKLLVVHLVNFIPDRFFAFKYKMELTSTQGPIVLKGNELLMVASYVFDRLLALGYEELKVPDNEARWE